VSLTLLDLFDSYALKLNHAGYVDLQIIRRLIMNQLQATRGSFRKIGGFSLIELMVTVGVIGIVAAIAMPMYTNYMQTASEGVMSNNIETIRLFEEDYKLSEGVYLAGTYDPADPDAAGGLKAKLGWEPRTDQNTITYVVDNVSASGFRVTATSTAGDTVVKSYP